jgi:glucosylceramidase
VVTVADGTVTPNAEYYVLAHAARFVPRGSVRVGSSASTGTLSPVAFRAPTGPVTVVVHSTGWQARTVRVTVDGVGYPVRVEAWSTATVTVGRP